MKTVFLFLISSLFISSAYALPQCPADTQVRWHLCQGTVTSADGAKYVGEWRDNKKHGLGTETFADGAKYVGEFRDDKYHGQGTYTFADGRKYEGEWRDNKFLSE